MRYFINLHLKMLIGIGIQWYFNFLTTIFLIGLTSSYMYMYSIRFSSVSKKLCKIILNKLVWDKRHYSVSFFWPFFSLWLLFSLMHFQFCFKENIQDILITLSWKYFLTLIFHLTLTTLFFFFFVVHAIAKTVHTISSTKFQRYILMNNVTGSLIILLWPYLQFLPQYLLFCDYKPN